MPVPDARGEPYAADPRVRALNAAPMAHGKDVVVYWCQTARRAHDNLALEVALARANALGLPLLVYEALRSDYPHASDRFHTFVLQGARDTAARLAERGIAYTFFLPRTPDEARGVVKELARRAALIVTDDAPGFTSAHAAAVAPKIACALLAVDDNAVVPLALFPKAEVAARTLRPKLRKVLGDWLAPLTEARATRDPPARLDLPFSPLDFGAAGGFTDREIARLVGACGIDHAVSPVWAVPGGSLAAEARLDRFVRRHLASYAVDRNDPSRDDATSGLSPYLHFGMVSARAVALRVREEAEGRASEGADAFLEQLLVRRGLAFNFAARAAADRYDAIPAWAQATLDVHASDRRPEILDLRALEDARTPDELWNAAQIELRARGVIHTYLRMLWGKLVLTWTRTAREAHAHLVYLNDKYALDGRDPDGYANIAWCFGMHDRPWPERPIFGKVRAMTSRSARQKLDLEGYLAKARALRDEAGLD